MRLNQLSRDAPDVNQGIHEDPHARTGPRPATWYDNKIRRRTELVENLDGEDRDEMACPIIFLMDMIADRETACRATRRHILV
jgi:hypothetical protein